MVPEREVEHIKPIYKSGVYGVRRIFFLHSERSREFIDFPTMFCVSFNFFFSKDSRVLDTFRFSR